MVSYPLFLNLPLLFLSLPPPLLPQQGHSLKSINSSNLHKRAERVGAYIMDKLKLNSGDHIALVYPAGIELIVAFYGCLYVGVVPVVIRPPLVNMLATVPTMKLTIEISNSLAILTCHPVMRVLKSKEASALLDLKSLPPILETDDLSKKKLERPYRAPTAELIAYLDFCVSTTGVLSGVKVGVVCKNCLFMFVVDINMFLFANCCVYRELTSLFEISSIVFFCLFCRCVLLCKFPPTMPPNHRSRMVLS